MSEKLLAGLMAAAVIAPLCAVCVLGPAAIAAIFAGVAASLGGLDVTLTAGLALVLGILAFAIVRKRRGSQAKPAEELSR